MGHKTPDSYDCDMEDISVDESSSDALCQKCKLDSNSDSYVDIQLDSKQKWKLCLPLNIKCLSRAQELRIIMKLML
jgi:hypothetical protein